MTLVIVRQGYAPMAVEASFIPWGTRVSISSVVRTVTGMAMIASATAPASAEKCPMRITSSSYTNRPMMNDVLLSGPSIIIGLFVCELLVIRMGHFSALADHQQLVHEQADDDRRGGQQHVV